MSISMELTAKKGNLNKECDHFEVKFTKPINSQWLHDVIHGALEIYKICICPYCDNEFVAIGKKRFDTEYCRLSHYQKKNLIDREAILEDGSIVIIKDMKRDYLLVKHSKYKRLQKVTSQKRKKEGLLKIVHIR